MKKPPIELTLLLALLVFADPTTFAQDGQDARRRNAARQNRARQQRMVFEPIEDDPTLPRVLIIGDSISIGYTLPLREELQREANVHRIPTNGGPTTRGLESIDEWLRDGNWDVIHFNWGLHDMKYVDKTGALASVQDGRQQVPIEEYVRNLDKLVKRLEQTGATLIWRNTTPVPEGAEGRVPGDAVRYNEAAAEVMARHRIPTDDHYAAVKPRLEEFQRPANVHFTDEGSEFLAGQAAQAIRKALADRKP